MIILQIFIGLFAAVGIGCILADLMKIPTMKASKAANNLGKKGDKKTSIIEIYLKEFATKLSEKLKLNEYKKAQLEADLRTAGMDISPEMYVSNAIVKSVAIGLLAIPAFLIFKLLGLFIAFVAIREKYPRTLSGLLPVFMQTKVFREPASISEKSLCD